MKKISTAGSICSIFLILLGSSIKFTVLPQNGIPRSGAGPRKSETTRNSTIQTQDNTASIEYYSANSKVPIKVKFSQEDLAKIDRNPEYLLRRLSSSDVKCCERRRRISSCIWVCCDGRNKVKTCDKSLTRALETTWGRSYPGSWLER